MNAAPGHAGLHRRTVLQAGAVLAAGLLASGCSPSRTVPARRGDATIPRSSVPVGGGVVLSQANFVVVQPTAGTFLAYVKVCTHAGCAVNAVTNNQIVCPCHGSRFDATDGHVLQGPARNALGRATVTADGDNLIVSG